MGDPDPPLSGSVTGLWLVLLTLRDHHEVLRTCRRSQVVAGDRLMSAVTGDTTTPPEPPRVVCVRTGMFHSVTSSSTNTYSCVRLLQWKTEIFLNDLRTRFSVENEPVTNTLVLFYMDQKNCSILSFELGIVHISRVLSPRYCHKEQIQYSPWDCEIVFCFAFCKTMAILRLTKSRA